MKRVITIILCLVVAVTVSLIGCTGEVKDTSTDESTDVTADESTDESTGEETVAPSYPEIIVPIATQPQIHGYLLQRAENEGFYDQFGVTGEFQMYNSGAPMNEALAAEQWKLGGIGVAAVISCIRYNSKIVAAANYEGMATLIYARAGSEIMETKGYVADSPNLYGTPETIKGATIITTVGSSLHYMVEKLISIMGLEMTDVEILNMDPTSATAAFKAGEGDILTTCTPFSWALGEADEYQIMGNINDVGGEVASVIIASEKTMAEEPNVIVQTLAGFLKTVEAAKSDKEGTIASLKQFLNENGYEPSDAQLEFEYDNKPIFTVDEQLALFEATDGGVGPMQQEFIKIANYLLSLEIITQEECDNFIANGFDGSYVEQVAALPEFN